MKKTLTQQEAIDALKASDAVTVSPYLIAAAMRMSPSVLRKHVRDGEYHISAYDIQGSRIRFFRRDFLQQIGEIPLDEEKPTVEQLLTDLIKICDYTNTLLALLLNYTKEKNAGAATPTN